MKKILLAAALLCPSVASAQTAVTFTGGTSTTAFGGRTQGYSFAVNQTINVGQLGFYDLGGNGLADSHDVGIWSENGTTLLSSATVSSGTSATLIDGFRFVNISTLTLDPGTYLIGGYNASGADAVVRYANASTIPQITLGSTRFDLASNAGRLVAPTGTQGTGFDDGYFGPSFRLAAASAVPEPATWAMMLIGFGFIGWSLRRVKRIATVNFA